MRFRRIKAFFLNNFFFIRFPNFSNFEFFSDSRQKNLNNKVERYFQEKLPFETHSRKKLLGVPILKNFMVFLIKKRIYFSKKPQLSNILRNLTIRVAFYGKFATIWWKNNFTCRREKICRCWRERNWQTSGKKNVRISAFERKILLPYF